MNGPLIDPSLTSHGNKARDVVTMASYLDPIPRVADGFMLAKFRLSLVLYLKTVASGLIQTSTDWAIVSNIKAL